MAGPVVTDTEIELGHGERTRAIFAHDRRSDGRPTVLVLGEIWGANHFVRDLCLRLAELGAVAIGPDPYRDGAPPGDDDPVERLHESFEAYDDIRGIRDLRAVVGAVRRGDLGFTPGPVYVWGFCMGGRFAHYLAAFDGRIAGAINCYGRVNFPRDAVRKPFIPMDVSGLVSAPYLGLFAGHDPVISAADVEALGASFASNRVVSRLRVFPDAEHGFFNRFRAFYDEAAAGEVWREATDLIMTGRFRGSD